MQAILFTSVMSIHAVFDGLSVGVEATPEGFYPIVTAVVFHKVFDGIAVGAAVFPAQFPVYIAWSLLLLPALATPLGIAIGMGATASLAGSAQATLAEAIVISLSAGSFLFIAITELLPSSLHDGRHVRTKMLCFFLGWLAMVLLAALGE